MSAILRVPGRDAHVGVPRATGRATFYTLPSSCLEL
jgi:hypothetical protein